MFVLVPVCVLGYMCVYQGIITCFSVSNCKLNFNIWSPNNEGSQFPKFHFPCNKEERFVLNSFFRKYNLYLKKKKTDKPAKGTLSSSQLLHVTSPHTYFNEFKYSRKFNLLR